MPDDNTPEGETVESPLAGLYARRKTLFDSVKPMVEARRVEREAFDARKTAEDESARPTVEERAEYVAAETQFNESVEARFADLKEIDARIEQEQALERSLELAQRASRTEPALSTQIREPLTYREDNQSKRSYFLDLAAMQIPEVRSRGGGIIDGYQERLERHSNEMADVWNKRLATAERRAESAVEDAEKDSRRRRGIGGYLSESPFTRSTQSTATNDPFEQRAPSRIVGQGGYAINERVALAA